MFEPFSSRFLRVSSVMDGGGPPWQRRVEHGEFDAMTMNSISECTKTSILPPLPPAETTGRRRLYVCMFLVLSFEGSDTLAFFHKPGPGPRGEGVNFIACESSPGETCASGARRRGTYIIYVRVYSRQIDRCEPLNLEKCPCPHTDIRSCAQRIVMQNSSEEYVY